MNETDVFKELLNEVRDLRQAVERGQDTDRPLTLKEAAAYLRLQEDTVARWALVLFAIRRWGTCPAPLFKARSRPF